MKQKETEALCEIHYLDDKLHVKIREGSKILDEFFIPLSSETTSENVEGWIEEWCLKNGFSEHQKRKKFSPKTFDRKNKLD